MAEWMHLVFVICICACFITTKAQPDNATSQASNAEVLPENQNFKKINALMQAFSSSIISSSIISGVFEGGVASNLENIGKIVTENATDTKPEIDARPDFSSSIISGVFDGGDASNLEKIGKIATENATVPEIDALPDKIVSEVGRRIHAAQDIGSTDEKPTTVTESVSDIVVTRIVAEKPTSIVSEATMAERLETVVTEMPMTETPKQTFKEAEKEITDFINSLMRSILPKIIGGGSAAHLSPKCTGAMMKVFGNVRRLKGWTLKMLDSMSKPSAGVLNGRSYSIGDYDECVGLSVTSRGHETSDPKEEMFRGMYCRVKLAFPEVVVQRAREYRKGRVNATELGKLKDIIQVIPFIPIKSTYMSHFLDLCFPSICTREDLNHLIELIPFPGTASLDRCEVRNDDGADSTQVTVIIFFLIFGFCITASTLVDWLLHLRRVPNRRDKRCVSASVCFSICSNTRFLLSNVEEDCEGMAAGHCVRGVYVASIAWLILGRTYLYPHEEYYFHMSSLKNLEIYRYDGPSSVIVSYPLCIDALCVCYGFLLTFGLWSTALKPKTVTVNIVSMIVKYYLRLCIPLLFCFGFVILLPLVGSGPFWKDIAEKNIENCRSNAWAYFGMYSNFLSKEDQCFPNLFLVSCLGQLTFVGILLARFLARNLKFGVLLTVILCIISNVVVGILTFKHDLPPAYSAYFKDDFTDMFWHVNMSLPLIHFGPYAAGMLSGIFVARKDTRRSRRCIAILGWLACIGILYAIQVALFNSKDGSFSLLTSALFASSHKTAFGMCVAWVLIAGSFGIGGFVNSILSWRVLDPLYKLSYNVYLYHFIIITYLVGVIREHYSYTHLELILRALSYFVVSYFVAFVSYMFLEAPLKSLKRALGPNKTSKLDLTSSAFNNFVQDKTDFASKSSIEGSCKLWSITDSRNSHSS